MIYVRMLSFCLAIFLIWDAILKLRELTTACYNISAGPKFLKLWGKMCCLPIPYLQKALKASKALTYLQV